MKTRQARQILRRHEGAAALEFALILPVLCLLVFALYEVAQGVICYYRVVDAANSVADLIGQTPRQGGVGNTDFDNFYLAGEAVMSAGTGSGLRLAMASVTFDNNGLNPTVAWQVQRGGAAAMTNLAAAAASLGSPNGSVIAVRATYAYNSPLDHFISSPITLSQQVFAVPRALDKVPCPPPGTSQSCN